MVQESNGVAVTIYVPHPTCVTSSLERVEGSYLDESTCVNQYDIVGFR